MLKLEEYITSEDIAEITNKSAIAYHLALCGYSNDAIARQIGESVFTTKLLITFVQTTTMMAEKYDAISRGK